MKTFIKFLAVVFAVSIVSFGCKPEQSVDPKNNKNNPDASIAGEDPHNRPDPQCMASVFSDIMDNQGNTSGGDPFDAGVGPYGRVEVVNGNTYLNVMISMGFYWLCADGSVFVGQCGQVPLNSDGSVNWEAFQWGSTVPVVQYWQWDVPLSTLSLDAAGCACVVVAMEGVQSDFYGNVFNNTRLWAQGDKNVGTNGRAITACPVPCPFLSHQPCNDVNPAAGRTCTDLTVVASTATVAGSAPFTFKWYDASNTLIATHTGNMTGSDVLNVCPTAATSYYVTVNDSRSVYTDRDTVSVGINTCGIAPCSIPHPTTITTATMAAYDCTPGNRPTPKVNVCHIPPGNPANRHTICIDWSALPAHVIDFKPANNRCMGHVSGCHIGPCDPCGVGSSGDEIARAAAYAQQYNCH